MVLSTLRKRGMSTDEDAYLDKSGKGFGVREAGSTRSASDSKGSMESYRKDAPAIVMRNAEGAR